MEFLSTSSHVVEPISVTGTSKVSTGQDAWPQDTRLRDLPAIFFRGHFRFVKSGCIKQQLASEIEKRKLQCDELSESLSVLICGREINTYGLQPWAVLAPHLGSPFISEQF